MMVRSRSWLVGGALLLVGGWALAQAPAPAPTPTPMAETPPPATAVAATVNGQPIPELAVFRGLQRVNPKLREQARKDVLNYLIDNLVVDQYLAQLKVQVDAKDVDAQLDKIKAEAKKTSQDFDKMLGKLHLTEADLRRELSSALTWDKFVLQQGTDKVLKDMFDKNTAMFDGSRMQAKHILIGAEDGKKDEALAKLTGIKKQIEGQVAQELAKLPADADALGREKERVKALDKAFGDAAAKDSTCPSKANGGDLGYFPRVGAMVEPFARAAFALKPYQMSDPVATEFGYHLILAVDHKPGKDVKFEDVKPFVLEVYGEKLREAVIAQYKPRSKIAVEAKK